MSNDNKGFTLIEVLIALGIAGVVLAAAYATFMSQNNSYKRQEQITEMQQNLRAALTFMARDIRMAGLNPKRTDKPKIESAESDSINFTLDLNGDGDVDDKVDGEYENITYELYDPDNNGDKKIGRRYKYIDSSGSHSHLDPLVENIDVLNFVYLKNDGNVATAISDIKAVQITIIARTERAFPNYTDATRYKNLQDETIWPTASTQPNEYRYRRRIASTTLNFRNIPQ